MDQEQLEKLRKLAQYNALIRELDAQYMKLTTAVGLELQQYRALMVIAATPLAWQPLQVTRFARVFRLNSSGATELLNRLEEKDLIRRESEITDGRIRVIYLTPRGESLLIPLSTLNYDILTSRRDDIKKVLDQL